MSPLLFLMGAPVNWHVLSLSFVACGHVLPFSLLFLFIIPLYSFNNTTSCNLLMAIATIHLHTKWSYIYIYRKGINGQIIAGQSFTHLLFHFLLCSAKFNRRRRWFNNDKNCSTTLEQRMADLVTWWLWPAGWVKEISQKTDRPQTMYYYAIPVNRHSHSLTHLLFLTWSRIKYSLIHIYLNICRQIHIDIRHYRKKDKNSQTIFFALLKFTGICSTTKAAAAAATFITNNNNNNQIELTHNLYFVPLKQVTLIKRTT